jgi:pimeloyl-ACP methyl ester carboxylesterase
MQVVVDSLLTQYERVGKGKPVVILHGWADSSAGWHAFSSGLADSFDVISIDLPGFGGTEMPSKPWGLDEYAAFVGAFLKKIRVTPYALVGHSNGGAIAVRGLATGSLHTERLVLLDSAGIRNMYKGRNGMLRAITKTGKFIAMPLPKSVKKRLRRKVYKTVGSDMLVVERLQETFKRVVTDDIQANAAVLHSRTLLIYGEDDLATPVQYGRLLHNLIGGSTLEVVPEAGHFVHLDKPDVVLQRVRGFLA